MFKSFLQCDKGASHIFKDRSNYMFCNFQNHNTNTPGTKNLLLSAKTVNYGKLTCRTENCVIALDLYILCVAKRIAVY